MRVHGNVGVGVAENIMSGSVVVDGSASQSAGATGHGGLRRDPRRRVGPLRHLDEGRGHRRARLGRAHERVHGPEGTPGGLRRRRRGARRLDLRGAPVRARRRGGAGRRLRREGDARGARRRARRRCSTAAEVDDATRPTSAATARRGGSTTSTSTTRARTTGLRESAALRPPHDRRDPARRARGHLRHPRLRRQARACRTSTTCFPRREHVALPARGLPRALRHRRDARRPPRRQAAPPRHPDHDRRHELRRAVGAGQGGARARRERGRHEHDDRRRRHDARGARALEHCSSTSCCPRATG